MERMSDAQKQQVTANEAQESGESFLQHLGPGLITGAADDDPSGIATYSEVGAQFGFGMLWTTLFSYPLMASIREICGRLGRITGMGIAAVGVRGFRIEDGRDLKSSLIAALRHRGPALVDVVTNPNALALPPKIDAKEVAGYGLYVAKQTLHGRLFESIEELKGNLP
jgi:Natural resistance-associated macrophage protein